MIIKSLSLTNFGATKQGFLSFQPGFNLIVGDIGQGKSHSIYSIAYLLLNTVKDRKIENLVNWDAESFKTEMTLDHERKSFFIASQYDGSNNRELKITGEAEKVHLNTTSDVTKKLAEYFDPSLCRAAILSFQGETDIVSSTPAIRRDAFRKIYDLEFTSQISDLEAQITKLTDSDLASLTQTIFALTSKTYDYKEMIPLPFDKEERGNKQVKIQALELEIERTKAEQQSYNFRKQERSSLVNSIVEHNKDIETITTNIIEEQKSIKELQASLSTDRIAEQIEALRKQSDEMDFEKELRGLKEQREELKDIVLIRYNPSALEKIGKEVSEATSKYLQASDHVTAAKNGKCPTCDREFSTSDISVYEKEYESALSTLTEKKEELSKIQKTEKEYNDLIKQQDRVTSMRTLLDSQIRAEEDRIEQKVNAILLSKNDLEKSFQEKTSLCAQAVANSNEKLKKWNSSLDVKKEELVNLEGSLKAFVLPEEEPVVPDSMLQEKKELQKIVIQYDSIMQTNELLTKSNESLKEQQEKDTKRLEEVGIQKAEVEEQIANLTRASVILKKEFPNYVINKTLKGVEEGTNAFIDQVYNGRYHIKITENKFGINILYGPKDSDIRLSSGGEQDLFNIGLKYSFCKLTKLGMLILDEVDKFLSVEQSRHLFSVLNNKICDPNDILQQVILVTHKEEIKELLSADYGAKTFRAKNSIVEEE